jgi:ribosomal protein S18 acetylase RimI-like enzyme
MRVPIERENGIVIRPLREADLSAADHIMRVAFGTLIGVPEPAGFFGDASWVPNRWRADRNAAWAADRDGEVVGSIFLTHWGSFAFVGPLTIRPDLWDRGIGSRLMEPVMSLLAEGGIRLAGLFTDPHSAKHIGLYQKFGFWPRYLTAVMSKSVESARSSLHWNRYSELSTDEKAVCLHACREICHSLFEGFDPTPEVRAIDTLGLGDTILIRDGSELAGFAACHQGARTEAGSGVCYVKFAAVRPQGDVGHWFAELLVACEAFAASRGASRLTAGVNTSRHEAYRHMLQRGFRTDILGVAMHRPNEPGFSRAGVYVLDDWR